MKNILVIGGAGYIGSHTAVELHTAGYRPVIIDNFDNSYATSIDGIAKITGERPAFYEADYTDTKNLQEIIDKEKIDGVIHFAALKAVGDSVNEPLRYYQNNVAGFLGLLKVLDDKGIPIVFSSSCSVYGEPDSSPVNEQAPFKPAESPYGASKQMDEIMLRDVTKVSNKLKSIALRYFNPIGAHPSTIIGEQPVGEASGLFPRLTRAADGSGETLTVFGDDYDTPDGSCIRDFIHIVDLARAHVKALDYLDSQKAAFYDVLNIGTGTGNTVLDVIRTFEKTTKVKVPHVIGARRPGDVIAIYGNASKAEKTLGWKAEKTLAEACTDAWKWQQKVSKK
jgi:UDP-glucose 4-epimerase